MRGAERAAVIDRVRWQSEGPAPCCLSIQDSSKSSRTGEAVAGAAVAGAAVATNSMCRDGERGVGAFQAEKAVRSCSAEKFLSSPAIFRVAAFFIDLAFMPLRAGARILDRLRGDSDAAARRIISSGGVEMAARICLLTSHRRPMLTVLRITTCRTIRRDQHHRPHKICQFSRTSGMISTFPRKKTREFSPDAVPSTRRQRK